MPDNWLSYYWALAKEFGAECLHITRSDMLATVLAIILTFLKTGNAIEVRTGLLICFEVLLILGILHSLRLPWQLFERMRDNKPQLSNWWGVLGVAFFSLFICALVYGVAYVATMQPVVLIEARLPDGRNKRNVELDTEVNELRAKLPAEKSLKVRLLQAANDYEELWRRPPKEPICTQTNTMTPEEQRKVIAPCVAWMNARDTEYQRFLAPEIIELIRIAKGKGADVSQDLEQCAPTGACGQNPLPLRLRALSKSLNTHDEVVH